MFNFERIRWDRAWAAAFPGQPSLRLAAEIFRDKSEGVKEGEVEPKELELIGTYIVSHFGPFFRIAIWN